MPSLMDGVKKNLRARFNRNFEANYDTFNTNSHIWQRIRFFGKFDCMIPHRKSFGWVMKRVLRIELWN